MNENEKTTQPKQICTIRIMFPVESDDEAIEYKKRITNALSDKPEARIDFSLSNMSR